MVEGWSVSVAMWRGGHGENPGEEEEELGYVEEWEVVALTWLFRSVATVRLPIPEASPWRLGMRRPWWLGHGHLDRWERLESRSRRHHPGVWGSVRRGGSDMAP